MAIRANNDALGNLKLDGRPGIHPQLRNVRHFFIIVHMVEVQCARMAFVAAVSASSLNLVCVDAISVAKKSVA